MTELTQQDIDNHCARLNISRENLTEFVIPDGITEIGDAAFEDALYSHPSLFLIVSL